MKAGDLLVVNESATLGASLPAIGPDGPLLVNLSTQYGPELWLVEPRWSFSRPGPLDLKPGQHLIVAGLRATLVARYPGLERLWFMRFEKPPQQAIEQSGKPIRYAYVDSEPSLDEYQTLFAHVPGSAEMPSAARSFTHEIVSRLRRRGVHLTSLVLHTGVSSLEVEVNEVEDQPLYPEPYSVPEATARRVNSTTKSGGRVIAVGTTVARALETVWDGEKVVAGSGFTRVYIHPGHRVHSFDGLLTGFHDSKTTHLALLYAVAGKGPVLEAYRAAVGASYLWHEFGDSHLILPESRSLRAGRLAHPRLHRN